MEERITVTRSQHKGLNGILNLFFQRDERNVNDVYADDSYDLLIFFMAFSLVTFENIHFLVFLSAYSFSGLWIVYIDPKLFISRIEKVPSATRSDAFFGVWKVLGQAVGGFAKCFWHLDG